MKARRSIRPAAVAGRFYPAQHQALTSAVVEYLNHPVYEGRRVQALIAPHAGYVFSGALCGQAYAAVNVGPSVLWLWGPSHYVATRNWTGCEHTHWATPLGEVPLERVLLEVWAREGRIELRNVAHSEEHSLETHVPFLQKRWPGTPIVPLLTPYRDDPDAVDWLAEAWHPDVLVAVSSDLSHFHPLTEAERMDRLTEAAVEALRPEAIGPEDACGWVGMRTLLRLAARKEWQAHLLGRSHSSKVSGDARSVVGYGAWVFTEAG